MALIRNDKHDTRNDKHGQPTDSNEQRKEKHEHRKRKDLTHEGPNQNPENTYVSYRDSEADIEYTLTRKDVISNNGLAEQSVDLIDTSKEQAQEYQRNFKELSENDIVKQTDMSKVRSQSNGEQSGTVILEEQNGAIRNGDENSRMRVADQSGTERIVKQSGAVRNNEHCESEIVWDRSGSRSWTKSDEKACLLGVSSLTYESKSELKNEQLLMAGTMYTVDTGIANSCADGNDLEGAKDKVFGKKRVLTEVLSNAYSIKSKPNVETYDFEGQKSDIADRYMYDKTNFKNKYMTKLNTNARVKIDVDRDDYVNGNGYFQECEVVSPADLLNNEKKCNVQKDKTEEDNCTVTKGENNVHNTGLEHSHNGINKASTISDQEQKVHRYIDETSEQQDSLDFDNTVKSAYEELNMSRHGTASDNIETNGTRYTDVDQQNLPAEPHSGDDVPRNRRRNGKDKKLNKDNYATESRAALRAKTKTNALHRRYASEGALGSNLENLFQGTKWRPLSTNFQDYIATVAIDFGTAYSGYAYCLTHFPDIIYMMRKPEGGDPGIYNQKTPTSILLTPEGSFHSFGYSARDYFHDLEPREAQTWMYFERFKMLLHSNENVTADTKLVSDSGKEASALVVFSYGLAYFKDHALRELSDQSGLRITSDVIKWVITVPAIWRASAKQFMRQAAYNAGIVTPDNHDHLLIALEPEAASLYCLRQRLLHPAEIGTADDSGGRFSPSASLETLFTTETNVGVIEPGHGVAYQGTNESSGSSCRSVHLPGPTGAFASNARRGGGTVYVVSWTVSSLGIRYMIVDCGGGTTDITVHQIDNGGRLKEIHKAVGGPFGSIGIDREFESLLHAVFGKDIMQLFKTKRPAGWVDLMTGFESRKRGTGPYRTTCTTVSLPFSFMDFFKRRKSNSVESAVKKFGSKDITYTSSGMLRLSPALMRRLFQPTINSIKQEIGNVLNHPDTRGLSYLLLVGGLAESSMLQHEIRKEFGHILKIIIPQGVSTITAKGAVLYGLNPDVIVQRRSRLTYGVGVLRRFKPEKHPASKRIIKDGIAWCSDILDRFVSVNQCVGIGETVIRSYTPVRQDQTSTIINIYSTERDDAEFITDRGVNHCGTLRLTLNTEDDRLLSEFGYIERRDITGDAINTDARYTGRREIRASMLFGDTEIKVTAVDMRTGRTVNAGIDFLNS